MPELRRDPIIGRWVIISASRGKRPNHFQEQNDFPQGGACPFCPGNEDKTPSEIMAHGHSGREKDKAGWSIRVIPNKFPALEIEGELNRSGEGLYDRMNGVGAHEVIIETPDHQQSIHQLDNGKLQDVIWTFRDRTLDLMKDPRLEYILLFKNHGAAAGASLLHSHSQLIAIPMVPISVKQEMDGARRYFDYKERCVYCDIVRQEQAQKIRLVAENRDFIVFAPFASRNPFELWIVPQRHDSDFHQISKNEVDSLAQMMKEALGRHHFVLNNPPYNFILHTGPMRTSGLPFFHWYIEVVPKLTKHAGFEQGTGFYINPTPPEEAADLLRSAPLA